ncbi:DUF2635 domain-containing protein [Enterobacter hormaechei]|uniref:DUF2635 domain-containing protein n=1 Tax=Enterobacter hormaechei TaxID=158836 RepID=UPI001868F986|nr:DUF2635 domain-containing protein [Enterobacter hormaechei]
MAQIKVKAAPGLKFPMERNAKKHITGEAITVESSAYYRRAIADGDLVLVTEGKGEVVSQDAGEAPAAAESKDTAPVQTKQQKKAAPNE